MLKNTIKNLKEWPYMSFMYYISIGVTLKLLYIDNNKLTCNQ